VFEHIEANGLPLLVAPDLGRAGVSVVFSGRRGSQGVPPFDGLNLSYSVGDDRRHVSSSRDSLAAAAGFDMSGAVFLRQVHGTVVRRVGPLELGRGSRDFESALPGSDAAVTATRGVSLGILTADCIPLALVSKNGSAAVAVHAGWRGLVAGVVGNSVRALSRLARAEPSDILAFVGPHIESCCFEVGEDVADDFRSRFSRDVVAGRGVPHVDMTLSCLMALEEEGIPTGNVHFAGDCTCCSDDYFSFRRSGGTTGRQGLIVSLLEPEGERG